MKYKTVLQLSEENCAACIPAVTKHYGHTFPIGRVRETIGTSKRKKQ